MIERSREDGKFDQIECTFDDEGASSYDTSQSIGHGRDVVSGGGQTFGQESVFHARGEVKTEENESEEAEAFRKNFCWTLRHPQGPRRCSH